jgi:glutamine synthetase
MPPPSVDVNIYEMTAAQREERGIASLPGSLHSAIMLMQQDALVTGVLGPHITDRYVDAKLKDWESYREQVTAWELDKYFKTY